MPLGHEAVSRAPAGGGAAFDLIAETRENLRSQMGQTKIEVDTHIRVAQENNERHMAQAMQDITQNIKNITEKIDELELEKVDKFAEMVTPRITKLEEKIKNNFNDKIDENIEDKLQNIKDEFIMSKIKPIIGHNPSNLFQKFETSEIKPFLQFIRVLSSIAGNYA